ncbi:unnamed protein product, partial [Lymnaea stagnalis]
MLMMSLSCSDLAYSTLVMPFCVLEVIENGRWLFGEILCHARSVMVYYFLSVSIYHVACMAVDRYIAISKPFLYRNFTIKTGYVMIGVSWMLPVLIQFLPHFLGWANIEENIIFKCHDKECLHIFKQGSFIACIIVGFCIPFLIPYLCYILILRIVMKFNTRRKKHVGKTFEGAFSSKSAPAKRNLKAYGTVGSILICFTICWSPTCGFVVTFLRAGDPMQPWFFVMVMWIANLNMALNPLLY